MRSPWWSAWRRWPAARGLRSRWALLSAATLLYWVANQAIRPFLPLRLQELGASDLTIGVAVAGSSVAGVVLAVPSGRLLDRLPQRGVLTGSLVGLGLTTASFAVTTSVAVLAAEMVVNGAFAMWVWLVLQSMVTHVAEPASRADQLSLFSLAWGIGLAGGPSVGAIAYDAATFPVLAVAAALLVVVAFAVSVGTPQVRVAREPAADSVPGDDRFPAVLGRTMGDAVLVSVLLSSFVNLCVMSIRTSFYPVYLERAGVDVATIGVLLSLIGIFSLLVRAVLPMAVDRFGVFAVLLWSTWLGIVGVVLTPVSTATAVLVVGALLMGVGLGANPPITVDLVARYSAPRDRGVAVGLRMVANRTAQIVQPLLFGGLAGITGLAAAFPVSGLLLGGLAAWMGVRLRSRPSEG